MSEKQLFGQTVNEGQTMADAEAMAQAARAAEMVEASDDAESMRAALRSEVAAKLNAIQGFDAWKAAKDAIADLPPSKALQILRAFVADKPGAAPAARSEFRQNPGDPTPLMERNLSTTARMLLAGKCEEAGRRPDFTAALDELTPEEFNAVGVRLGYIDPKPPLFGGNLWDIARKNRQAEINGRREDRGAEPAGKKPFGF